MDNYKKINAIYKKAIISKKVVAFFYLSAILLKKNSGNKKKHTPKKGDDDAITENKIPFIFYKRRHDGTIKISDHCM